MNFPKLKPLSETDRSFTMALMWFGLAGALLFLLQQFTGPIPGLYSASIGLVAGTLIAQPLTFRQDEFYRRCASFASAWAVAVPGIWLMLLAFGMKGGAAADTMLWLALTGATYHTAFAIARIKG